jgi:hypothetical protein
MLAMLGGVTEVSVNLTVPGIVALVAGILILLIPRLLNYIVAAYLIIIGFIQVFDVTL